MYSVWIDGKYLNSFASLGYARHMAISHHEGRDAGYSEIRDSNGNNVFSIGMPKYDIQDVGCHIYESPRG